MKSAPAYLKAKLQHRPERNLVFRPTKPVYCQNLSCSSRHIAKGELKIYFILLFFVVKNYDLTVSISIISVRDTSEPLLSGRVPNLQPHNFFIDRDTFTLQKNSLKIKTWHSMAYVLP